MKKILFATLLSFSCISAFAADTAKSNVDPAFVKAQELIQAKNYPAAYQELERLAKAGLILGWVGLGLGFLVICLSVLMFLGFFGGIAFCGPLSELINSAR